MKSPKTILNAVICCCLCGLSILIMFYPSYHMALLRYIDSNNKFQRVAIFATSLDIVNPTTPQQLGGALMQTICRSQLRCFGSDLFPLASGACHTNEQLHFSNVCWNSQGVRPGFFTRLLTNFWKNERKLCNALTLVAQK